MKTSADLQEQLDRINTDSHVDDPNTDISQVLQRISTQIGKVDGSLPTQEQIPLERQATPAASLPEPGHEQNNSLTSDTHAALAQISAGLAPTATTTQMPSHDDTPEQPQPSIFESVRQNAISNAVAEQPQPEPARVEPEIFAQPEAVSTAIPQAAAMMQPETAVEQSVPVSVHGTDDILTNLQDQVVQISNQLERFDDMEHQLAQLASAVENASTATPDMLRAAANEALAGIAAPTANEDAGSNAGLKKLEEMFGAYIEERRTGDEHTASAIDALQSAMLHLLDRLEGPEPTAEPMPANVEQDFVAAEPVLPSTEPEVMAEQVAPNAEAAQRERAPRPQVEAASSEEKPKGLGKLFKRAKTTDSESVDTNSEDSKKGVPWWKQDVDAMIEEDLDGTSIIDEGLDVLDKHRPQPGVETPSPHATQSIAVDDGPALADTPEYLNAARIAAQQAKIASDAAEDAKPKRGINLFKRDKLATIAMGASAALIAGACATLVLRADNNLQSARIQPSIDLVAAPSRVDERQTRSVANTAAPKRERIDHAIKTGSDFVAPAGHTDTNTRVAHTNPANSLQNVDNGQQIAGYVVPQGFSIGTTQHQRPANTLTPRDLPVEKTALVPVQPPVAQATQNYVSNVALPATSTGTLPLRARAARGNAAAQFEVASQYSKGKTKNYAQAAKWYKQSAAQGFALSQYRLAALYEQGKGLKRDANRARIWYRRAAEQGNVKAMHNLAVLYANRKQPDYKTAAAWFARAAAHGLTDSQFNLGILHENGLGIPANRTEAYKYFSLAARNGDQLAKKSASEVSKKLSSQQRDLIDRFIIKWLPANAAPFANNPAAAKAHWAQNAKPSTAQLTAQAQSLLAALGYDAGPADGKAGPKTRNAIRNFELSRSLAPTGRVSEALVQKLRAANS